MGILQPMKKEHFPSLELCKKLTEIGFPETENRISDEWIHTEEQYINWDIPSENYVCPSVMEMIDVLPEIIEDKYGIDYRLSISPHGCWYEEFCNDTIGLFQWKIPKALAEVTIWLYENKYITFYKK